METTGPRLITAKYRGKCSVCKGDIEAGTPIFWDKASKTVSHEQCPDKELFRGEEDSGEKEDDWP